MGDQGGLIVHLPPDSNRLKILNCVAKKILFSRLLFEEDDNFMKLAWPLRDYPEQKSNFQLVSYLCTITGGIAAAFCSKKWECFPIAIAMHAYISGAKYLYIRNTHRNIEKCINKLIYLIQEQTSLDKKIQDYLRHRNTAFFQLGETLNCTKLYNAMRESEKKFGLGFINNNRIMCQELCSVISYWKEMLTMTPYDFIFELSWELLNPDGDCNVDDIYKIYQKAVDLMLLSTSSALCMTVVGLSRTIIENPKKFDKMLRHILPKTVKNIEFLVTENKSQYNKVCNQLLPELEKIPVLLPKFKSPYYVILNQYMRRLQLSFDIAKGILNYVDKEGEEIDKTATVYSLNQISSFHSSAKNDLDVLMKIANKTKKLEKPKHIVVKFTLPIETTHHHDDPAEETQEEEYSFDMKDLDYDDSVEVLRRFSNYDVDGSTASSHRSVMVELQAALDAMNVKKGKRFDTLAVPPSIGGILTYPDGADVPSSDIAGGNDVPPSDNAGGSDVPPLDNAGGSDVPSSDNAGGSDVPSLNIAGGSNVPVPPSDDALSARLRDLGMIIPQPPPMNLMSYSLPPLPPPPVFNPAGYPYNITAPPAPPTSPASPAPPAQLDRTSFVDSVMDMSKRYKREEETFGED